MSRRILVTSALPYANGDIHLGHLLEYIQTDIWVRYQRQQGNECHYVCADDAHGAAIMLKAEQEGVTPEALIAKVGRQHEHDLRAFGVDFSNYHSTHSPENQRLSEGIYTELKTGGYIFTRSINQLYDPERGMFLADRFVKGDCPQCHSPDQYGDSCEKCGTTYRPTQLGNPRSVISGATPQMRHSDHEFFDLPAFADMLHQWHASGSIQSSVRNKLAEWFNEGLQAWDITRDAPYFGFLVPGTIDKYLYVWLDAPVGYMASFANFCEKQGGLNFDDFWKGEDTELHHFIGKDIVYFHTLFWPAMLQGAGWRKPTGVYAHGFVSINGEKMSKSRGTFITAKRYLENLEPEYLRYYFASKLSDGLDDIDLDLHDFVAKVNSDMGGKLVNIAARSARFINSYFSHQLAAGLGEYQQLLDEHRCRADEIAALYEARQFSRVIKRVMEMADRCNALIDAKAPWKMIKQQELHSQVQQLCSAMLEHYWLMIGYLQPVLPGLFHRSSQLFGGDCALPTSMAVAPLGARRMQRFEHLFRRLDTARVDGLICQETSV